MSAAIEQIQKLENELISLAHYDDRLRRALDRSTDAKEEVVLIRERRLVDRRIRTALAEVNALDANFIRRHGELSNLASWYREAARPLVNFFGIEKIEAVG